jgi:integrase
VTAYALRHSTASHLLAAGTSPAEVAVQLGHKNAQITLAIYAHALPGSIERTSATLAKAILGA